MNVLAYRNIFRHVIYNNFTTNIRNTFWSNKKNLEMRGQPEYLSNTTVVYKLESHLFKPDKQREYLTNVKNIAGLVQSKKNLQETLELLGSWTVEVGNQDKAFHLWSFKGGFDKVTSARSILSNDRDYIDLWIDQGKYVKSRHLKYVFSFTFWPDIRLRSPSNLYEMRSYTLKPGSMIDWSNHYVKSMKHRKTNRETFAGFLTEIGYLYKVYHIWCYKNFEDRYQIRGMTCENPTWQTGIAQAVPLIRKMTSCILIPTEFSPTK